MHSDHSEAAEPSLSGLEDTIEGYTPEVPDGGPVTAGTDVGGERERDTEGRERGMADDYLATTPASPTLHGIDRNRDDVNVGSIPTSTRVHRVKEVREREEGGGGGERDVRGVWVDVEVPDTISAVCTEPEAPDGFADSPAHKQVVSQKHAYGTAPIGGLLLRYAVPSCLAMGCIVCVPIIELYYLGQIGPDALSAAGALAPLMSLVSAFTGLSSRGAGVVMGQAVASGTQSRVRQAFWSSIFTCVTTVLAFVLIGGCVTLALTEDKTDIRSYALAEVVAAPIGLGAFGLTSAMLRSLGYNGYTLFITALGSLFVWVSCQILSGLGVGIAGPPISYGIAFLLCSLVGIIPVIKVTKPRFPTRGVLSDVKSILKAGSPALVSSVRVVSSAAFIVALQRVSAPIDYDTRLAISSIVERVVMVIVMPAMGVVSSVTPILAAACQHGDRDRLNRTVALTLTWALVIMAPGWLFSLASPGSIVSMFSSDETILDNVTIPVRITSLFSPGVLFLTFGSLVLSSAGQGYRAAVYSLVSVGAKLVLTLIGAYTGWIGLWVSDALHDIVCLVIGVLAIRSGLKRVSRGGIYIKQRENVECVERGDGQRVASTPVHIN
ncbi:multi antimicrobial extrusion protein [Kipferlia bialata]|uniref:Multi antimicrobial extrusion protein n=1 Tax=Kipferlia bialata TaxID=797122 RepID=A0A9K3GEM9_9EUKA|nr:multi antimicrobial extrusion protein [Kipferlia bialata]|eukprot:g766.t1